MSLATASRRRALTRLAGVVLVGTASVLLGAPAASAAEDERPVIALDPPDSFLFLFPAEGDLLALPEELAATSGDGAAAAAVALAEAASALPPEPAAALPPEFAAALGAEGAAAVLGTEGVPAGIGAEGGVTAQEHGELGGIHVLHGGTLTLQLPAVVDASSAVFTLDVDPRDAGQPPARYTSDPTPADQPLSVTSPAPSRFALTLPGPAASSLHTATLTVDGLTDATSGTELFFPLVYGLQFHPTAPAAVDLRPLLAVLARAECSVHLEETCPGPTVRAGGPVDLTVPTGSLLPALGLGQLDSAFFVLGPAEDVEPYVLYDSLTSPELVTVHRPRRATLHVPADAPAGPYMGAAMTFDPAIGVAMTIFELDVEGVPGNPGLHSNTGWVDEVREVSPGSTAAVAGGALLLVAGLVTVVAVRPVRRPPLEG